VKRELRCRRYVRDVDDVVRIVRPIVVGPPQ